MSTGSNAPLDENSRQGLYALSSANDNSRVDLWANPVTHALLTESSSGSGTVTEVDTGTGLTGGPITTTGTISLDSKLAPLDTLGTAGQLIRVNAGRTALEYFTASSGGVASVTGTANRIAVNNTDPANPIVDIDAAYVGQSSITTLGTISTGTWAGTTVALNHGGTGQTTKAAAFDALQPMTTGGDIIYGGTSGTGTRLANGSAGQVLTSGGTTVAPTWVTPTTGTVTSVTSANTALATVANGTTTPAITIVAAPAITSATTTVNTSSATAPSSGQVLTATSGTAATWQTPSGNAANITVGTTTITSGTNFRVLMDNSGVLGEYQTTGTGVVAMSISPSFTTPTLGVATATSINKMAITAPATSSTLAVADGKTLTANNTLTLAGTDSTTMTFPSTSATVARTDAAQTFTGTQTVSLLNTTPQALTVTSNAATADINHGIQNFTNSSAAAMTITLATTSAPDGQFKEIRIYDFSAVAQGITWVNTENSTVTVPPTSNGSTTLPLSVLLQFNGGTSKWRCIATA